MERSRLARCGEDVTIHPHARIVNPECLSLGNAVMVDDFAMVLARPHTVIGDHVHLAAFSLLAGGGELEIHDFAGVSGGARVYTGNDDYHGDWLTGPTIPPEFRHAHRGRVVIGRHAIVGANSVVLPDVTIGEGATVGALSLVKDDLEPWTIYAGVPARPVGRRKRERVLELEAQLARIERPAGSYIPLRDRR
jgi:galactoside O-acetyltransferase